MRGCTRTPQKERGRRLDSQRSGAEMGDGRSGLLPRPIAPFFGIFVALGFFRFVGESRPARRIEPVEISRRYPFPFRGPSAGCFANASR
jgi:hypothetical protein